MRVYLVDDEKPARGFLAHQLNKIEGIEIIGDSGCPLDAIEKINLLKPDLVFLDIEMPHLNGFEVLPYLACKPMIIFCTAYDAFAIKAFEVNALDYILKPVMLDRLKQSLQRAHNAWQKLENLHSTEGKPMGLQRLLCSVGAENKVVHLEQVCLIEKTGRYVSVQTHDQHEYLTDLTIDYIEQHLADPNFFRINRGLIVQRDHVVSFKKNPHGTLDVTPRFGETITVSRRRAKGFIDWLDTH